MLSYLQHCVSIWQSCYTNQSSHFHYPPSLTPNSHPTHTYLSIHRLFLCAIVSTALCVNLAMRSYKSILPLSLSSLINPNSHPTHTHLSTFLVCYRIYSIVCQFGNAVIQINPATFNPSQYVVMLPNGVSAWYYLFLLFSPSFASYSFSNP